MLGTKHQWRMRRATRFGRNDGQVNFMKLTTGFLSLAFSLSNAASAYTAPSDTDRYVALLAEFLERKSIGDDELVRLVENAEQGKVINPIPQDRAETCVTDFIDHETAQKWVDGGELDVAQVAQWAEENLIEQEHV